MGLMENKDIKKLSTEIDNKGFSLQGVCIDCI